MSLLEKDLYPSLPNVWTPRKKEIEIYLSFNNSLSVTDFYSSYMDANDTRTLKDGDITERYLKLKQYIRYVPKKELTSEDLVHHFTSLCESNQLKDWEAMMLLCYRKNHIILSVIDGCIKLIGLREYQKVAELLSKSWLKSLAPLIVLLTWHQCSCFSDAVLLLEFLFGLGSQVKFLSSACQKLVNQNEHTKWCIDKVREFLRSSSKCFESSNMDMFFRGLRSSSLLYALNDTKLIIILKYNELSYMLENQPNWCNNDDQYELISNEQDVYCCFYVLKCLIDLIMASICGTLIDFNGEKLLITEELILDYISDMRFITKNIASLYLKVELLENMFSLLFLRRSDFKHQPSEDIDCDNISIVSNLSRTLSRSLDSLLEDHGDHHENSFCLKKNDLLSVVLVGGQTVVPDSLSVQDVSESSSYTVKSAEDRLSIGMPTSNMPPGFVTSLFILKNVLSYISEDILLMSSKHKRQINTDDKESYLYPQELERRLSKISNYTSEAQWRLELVSSIKQKSENKNNAETYVSQMLGSSESLVYLTMKKQNVVQAEQVLRMYNLKGHACYEEVDFMKELSSSWVKLKTVSLSSKPIESQKTTSPLDMIRSNTSAGKVTSEATQIAENLLQHPIVVKGIHDFPMVDAAICMDLLFFVPLPFSICKSLLDLASIKSEICDEDDNIHEIFLARLKIIKSFLQLMNTKKYANVFEWSGQKIPIDFLTFYIHLPKKVYPEIGSFSDTLFQEGKDSFDELNTFIRNLYENYTELIEENTCTDDSDIMSKAKYLFSIFTPETIEKLNNISSVYDYMKSLIKYVNKFSRWQLNYKANDEVDVASEQSTTRILKAANPFLVFNEDISNTFGRLLFDWGVPPKKLESFAIHTNIKLVKIIAERCGVYVASNKKQSQRCDWSMLFQKHRVLNSSFSSICVNQSEPLLPQIVEDVLNNVIDVRNNALTLHDIAPELSKILNASTPELAKTDADVFSLHSYFLINLFNLLFLHSIMLIIDKNYDMKYSPEEVLDLLNRPFGRLIFYNHLAYQLGNLGTVSALDLYRKIVRCESASGYFGIHSDSYFSKIPSLQHDIMDISEYNLCFPVLHEVFDISTIHIFYQDTLKGVTEGLPLKYLEENIRISESKTEINITKFIFLHKQCFIHYLNELEEKKISKKEIMEIEKGGEQSDVDDGYVSNELNGVIDIVAIVNNGIDNDDQTESDDSCVSESNGNDDDIQILLTSLSNFASSDFSKMIKMALEKRFTIKIEKQNACLSNSNINNESHFHHPVVQRTQTFSYMSSDVSRYLEEACQLGGTLIELCLVKNQVLKQLTTIFSNNVLYNSVNEKDKMFSVFSSLQDGLMKFEKFTKYKSIRNIVVESSNYLESFMKHAEYFEFSLPSSLMNRFYSSLQNVFCDKFLQTFSPDHWSEIVPVLLECSFHSKHFWKIIVTNLELFLPIGNGLFEIILCHSISELKGIVAETSDSIHIIKRLIMLLDDSGNIFDNIRHCEHLLPIDDIIELTKACLEDENVLECNEMQTFLKRCKWYKEVFDLDLTHDGQEFSEWQDLKQFVEQEPESTLQMLIITQSDHLIIEWYEHFELSNDITEQCLQWKLKQLLNDDGIDYMTLQFNLDKIKTDELCLRICNYLIAENEGYNCRHLFIIQYMTNMLADLLDPFERGRLILNKIGILLIEMIPVELQDFYQCLQNNPVLIVEQLLMNMKIKLVEKALQCIRLETDGENIKEVANLSLECDELVALYAQLALDLSGLEQNRSMYCLDDLSNSESDGIRERKWSTVSQSVKKEKENYSLLQPVDRKKWVRDDDVVSCMLCCDLFNMFNRRHHCRHCGRVTCKACSPYYCFMVKYKRKVRICLKCYTSNYQKNNINAVDNNDIIYNVPHDLYVFDAPMPFTLTCNENKNEEIRTSFVYEKAPSATLCLSIVDLRTNHCAAAGLLIKFSKSVSEYLHESHEGIDLTVVAKMIELILYHAKLKFLKCGDFDGIELTESYCSQIETVKTLVESNWNDIPTMLELTQSESLRRLRDQLIEKEHFNLANEVTKNSGLDLTINFLMGLSRLKYGDLKKARVYFARCLTMTQGEKLSTFGSNQHYLVRIIDEIENSLFISINHVTKVDDALLPLPYIMLKQSQFQDCSLLDSIKYEEILFYLETYGSHGHILNFFFKNRLFKKAANLLKMEKCTPEQFVTHLLMPAFQEGCFGQLCNDMNFDHFNCFWVPVIHHSCKHLSKQGLYHCLYELQLVVKDLFRAALTCVRFFLGIGDPPRSYSQLSSRLKYLNLASSHLESLLKDRSRSNFVVGYSLLSEEKGMNQEVPISDIKRHLYTIKLQIEVTNFITSPVSLFDMKKVLTLFGNGKERAELVVQLLMHITNGTMAMIVKIINEFKLPTLPIIIRAIKKIINDGKNEIVFSLIQELEQNGLTTSIDNDEIYLQAVKVMVAANRNKSANQFIKLMKNDISKINALILCSHLREAYLEAVKNERFQYIENILEEAKKVGQRNMIDICEKWLKNYKEKGAKK